MRVLLITTEYPPHLFGGGGTFMYHLSRGLSKEGVKVYVVTSTPTKYIKFEKLRNIKIIRLPTLQLAPRHVWFQLQNLGRIFEIIARVKPHVVHANTYSAGLILYYLNSFGGKNVTQIPTIVTMHDYPKHKLIISFRSTRFMINKDQLRTYVLGYPVWDILYRYELELSSRIVAVSRFLKESILRDYPTLLNKLEVIHNSVDTDYICNIMKKYSRSKNSKGKIIKIVSGGRLFWEKGHLILLIILHKLIKEQKINNIKLILFGSGPLKSQLMTLRRKLGLEKHVVLTGFLPYKDVIKLIALSDIIAIPSLYEACPMFLIESLLTGNPVIVLRAPYIEEHLERGLYIEIFNDIDDAVDKFISIINDIEKYKEKAKRNIEIIKKKYSLKKMTLSYIRLYEEISSYSE